MDEAFFDEDMDYRDTMEQLIKERRRLCPVKLEYSRVLDDKVISELCKELKLDKKQVFYWSHHLRCHLYQRYRMT